MKEYSEIVKEVILRGSITTEEFDEKKKQFKANLERFRVIERLLTKDEIKELDKIYEGYCIDYLRWESNQIPFDDPIHLQLYNKS